MTFLETLRNIKSDYLRMSELQGIKLLPIRFLFVAITPGIVALTLYRFSHYFYVKRVRALAWLLWLLNQYVTGADITPSTEIGEVMLSRPSGGHDNCRKIREERDDVLRPWHRRRHGSWRRWCR